MNTDKHTPGPWAIEVNGNGETSGIISANGGLTHVCDTFDAVWHNAIARGQTEPATRFLAQSQANARLIAAAPELLEALAQVESRLTKAANAFYVSGKAKDLQAAFEGWKADAHKARAAVAKAKEDTP